MSDLLTVIGQWIEARIKTRGLIYKVATGLLFAVILVLFLRDILQSTGAAE